MRSIHDSVFPEAEICHYKIKNKIVRTTFYFFWTTSYVAMSENLKSRHDETKVVQKR